MGHYARNVEGLKMVDVSGQLHVVQSSDTEIFNALAEFRVDWNCCRTNLEG